MIWIERFLLLFLCGNCQNPTYFVIRMAVIMHNVCYITDYHSLERNTKLRKTHPLYLQAWKITFINSWDHGHLGGKSLTPVHFILWMSLLNKIKVLWYNTTYFAVEAFSTLNSLLMSSTTSTTRFSWFSFSFVFLCHRILENKETVDICVKMSDLICTSYLSTFSTLHSQTHIHMYM